MRNKTQRLTTQLVGYTVQVEPDTGRLRIQQGFEWSRWYQVGTGKQKDFKSDFDALNKDFPDVAFYFVKRGIESAPKTRVGNECVTNFDGTAVRGQYIKNELGNEELYHNLEDFSKVLGVSIEELKAEFGI